MRKAPQRTDQERLELIMFWVPFIIMLIMIFGPMIWAMWTDPKA